MFEMSFLYVLIAIFVLKPTHQQYQRSVPACSDNGETFCTSCSTASFCISSAGTLMQYNTNCAGLTPMCGPDTNDPSKFGCMNTIADCSCTGTTGLSYKSDPYNEQWYILCGGSSPAYIDCGEGNFYNEAEHNCVNYPPSPTTTTTTTTTTPAPSICTVSGAGAHDYNDTCNTFFVCTSPSADPIDGTCQAPISYFDPVTSECREPPARFQCPPEVVGTVGDPYDCRRYYVCFNEDLFDVGCCDPTEVFSELVDQCITGTAPPGCPISDECAMTVATDVTIAGTSASTASNSLTSTITSLLTTTPDGITSTSTITSTSSSTPEGITSTTSTPSTTASISTSDVITFTSTSTNTEITTTTEAATTKSTTTNQAPSCTPITGFVCPAPDGFFPQCNYCAKTYFRCVSGSATLGTCTGNTVFNIVPTYPSCLSPEFCPYYP